MMDKMVQTFSTIFKNNKSQSLFFAPGRINLIGEHTDYNGGHVLPAAISKGTYALASKRDDNIIRFYSMNFPSMGVMECHIDQLEFNKDHDWTNYPKGVLYYLKNKGYSFSGLDILYNGTIPNGAGLSSSASIEMVTAVLMKHLFTLSIEKIDMVKISKMVENNYIGVDSGIMDQFAIGFSKLDHAILLNCNNLQFDYVNAKFGDYALVIINTNKHRELTESDYNIRLLESNMALQNLQKKLAINNLCELTPEEFDKYKYLIEQPNHVKRAKHVIYENARTLEACKQLKKGKLKRFGELLNESHQSLKNDYEVTGLELDTIVHTAQGLTGVLGARMTGAGFGGCAIALVNKMNLEHFKQHVNATYYDTVGYDASFYDVKIGNGARKLEEVHII